MTFLTDEHWQGAELQELVHSICEPYRSISPDRIELEICRLHINPRATVALAMVFNELLTNAVKYGALSRPDGRVRIACRLIAEAQATLTIEWKETDGPRIDEPSRRGFGSALIEQTVKNELGGELLRFQPRRADLHHHRAVAAPAVASVVNFGRSRIRGGSLSPTGRGLE